MVKMRRTWVVRRNLSRQKEKGAVSGGLGGRLGKSSREAEQEVKGGKENAGEGTRDRDEKDGEDGEGTSDRDEKDGEDGEGTEGRASDEEGSKAAPQFPAMEL